MPEPDRGGAFVRLVPGLLLGAALVLAAALSVTDAARDSATADEPWHLGAAVDQELTGRWTLSPENPPLARIAYGRAAMAAGVRDFPRVSFRRYVDSLQDWLFDATRHDPDRLLRATRLAATAFLLATGAAVFLLAGGGWPGLLAAALLLGNTALFPHGHLATLDVPFALATALAAWALLGSLERPGLRSGALLALALGVALATKTTGFLLVALAGLVLLWEAFRRPDARRRLAATALLAPLAGLVVASALCRPYLRAVPAGTLDLLGRIAGFDEAHRAALEGIARVDPAAARFAFGLLFHAGMAAGQEGYLLGRVSAHPSPLYHLAAILLKSPLVWIAAVAAAALLARRTGGRAGRLLAWAGLGLVLSLPGPPIGVRHVFPVIVLASAGAGAAIAPLLARRSRVLTVAAAALALAPLATGRSLGSFGALGAAFRTPPLADSNLDWGQDLLRLRGALAARGIAPAQVEIAWFGGDRPEYRMPGIRDLARSAGAPRRYLAVSRQLELVGARTAVSGDRERLAAALALPRGRFLFRTGDSIDVFDRGVPVRPAP